MSEFTVGFSDKNQWVFQNCVVGCCLTNNTSDPAQRVKQNVAPFPSSPSAHILPP